MSRNLVGKIVEPPEWPKARDRVKEIAEEVAVGKLVPDGVRNIQAAVTVALVDLHARDLD